MLPPKEFELTAQLHQFSAILRNFTTKDYLTSSGIIQIAITLVAY